uniref:Guanine nucleotide exchange factor rei n=1 Tax=Caenorhabditis tropicalis TaxID=1561998 RepID=A0A1I7UMP4_9PELO
MTEGDDQLVSIRKQLENLNNATDGINSYEMKLENVTKQFCETQIMFNKEMTGIPKKMMKQISKSRPYFDLKSREPEIRRCVQQAALLFERQKTSVELAREQVQILHNSLNNNEESDAERQYVDVIEQQLNLVKEAEDECLKAEKMHAARVRELLQLETSLKKLLLEHGSSIKKARPYYERKEALTRTMNSQIELMSILEHEVQQRKDSYSDSMRALEQISEQIHQERSSQSSFAPSSDAESDSS